MRAGCPSALRRFFSPHMSKAALANRADLRSCHPMEVPPWLDTVVQQTDKSLTATHACAAQAR